jgi:transcriptional regulator with XRE-family HTH domain
VRGVVGEQKNNVDAYHGVRIVPLKNVELLKLGYRIRGARKVLGLSQKVFAAKYGLDRSYLGGVERGERNVTFGVLCAICVGLECDIAAITKCIPHPRRCLVKDPLASAPAMAKDRVSFPNQALEAENSLEPSYEDSHRWIHSMNLGARPFGPDRRACPCTIASANAN